MKTPKDDDSTVDLTGSASKKMKQARLPFKLLTPKAADKKSNEENADKDRAQNEKPCEEVTTDKKAKENAKTEEVIVLEDSVEMTDEFKNKSEPGKASTRKRSISVSPPKKVAARKRQKTLKTETSKSESESQTEEKKKANESKIETTDEGEDDDDDKEEAKRTPPRKKPLKRNASSMQDEEKLSPSQTGNSRRESPRKKRAKEDEGKVSSRKGEEEKSTTKGDEETKGESITEEDDEETKASPSKTENSRRESPRKKEAEKEEEIETARKKEAKEVEEEESPRKRAGEESKDTTTKDENSNKRQSSRIQASIKKNDNDSKPTSPKATPENQSKEEDEDGKRDGATPASASKTPKARKLTPTQLEKQKESAKKKAEREEKLLEKERLRKEKEEQMNKLKEEKLKMKQDKEEQKRKEREEKEELKKKEKEEKEELRKKEKEEKEKKRLAEIELKNEAKRQKEEEKKKQNEAREEERRRRDEAKEEERRKKDAEKRKAAEAFASFFKPKEANGSAEQEGQDAEMEVDKAAGEQMKFMPFEVKGDMRLSTVCRRTLDPSSKSALDEKIETQNDDVSDLYISLLKSKRHSPMTGEKTWPIVDETDDDVIIIEAEVNEENGCESAAKEVHKEKRTKRFKAKLLQFEENRRPPYWGTWRKKSYSIGARTPFNLDKTIFEYDVDSDEEWEEEEPGESLRGSDDENEKESEDEYEVDNKVFVPHGYLSDEEMQEEDVEDCSREAQKARLQLLEIEFQAEMTKKTEKLKPRLIGCVWFANTVADASSVGSRIAEMLLSRRMVLFDSEATLPIDPRLSTNTESASPVAASPLVEQASRKSKLPESAIPSLIKLVHGNQNKLSFLVREFSSHLTKNCQSTLDVPSMTAIRHKIRQLAKWMPFLAEDGATCPLAGKMCWYVGRDVREKYNLLLNDSELSADPWKYILPAPRKSIVLPANVAILDQPSTAESARSAASITKFTKKMTEEERKKQLLTSGTDNASSSTNSSPSNTALGKKTPSGKPANLLATFVSLKSVPSNSNSDVIVISPDKSEQELKEAPKPPIVKKRVQLTTLSTFGVSSNEKNPDSSGLKKGDAASVTNAPCSVKKDDAISVIEDNESSSVKKGVDSGSKESTNAKNCGGIGSKESASVKNDDDIGNKESTNVQNDETPSVKAQDHGSTPKPMNVSSNSPEDFLGFQSTDSTPSITNKSAAALKGLSKTPQSSSQSRAPRSIASFFARGSNKTMAKKLFDGKPAADEWGLRKEGGGATMSKNEDGSSKKEDAGATTSKKEDTGAITSKKEDASATTIVGQQDSKALVELTESSRGSSQQPEGTSKASVEPKKSLLKCEDVEMSKTSADKPNMSLQQPEVLESSKLAGDLSDDVDMNSKVPSTSSSPLQTPAKKRVQLTTLSPPKWRVKLAKPQPPASCSIDNDDEGVIVID